MTTLDLLRGARDLIADPLNWTQGQLVSGLQYCALGACLNVGGWEPLVLTDAMESLDAAARTLYGGMEIHQVNDGLGNDAVMRVFDFAIGRLEPARELVSA